MADPKVDILELPLLVMSNVIQKLTMDFAEKWDIKNSNCSNGRTLLLPVICFPYLSKVIASFWIRVE